VGDQDQITMNFQNVGPASAGQVHQRDPRQEFVFDENVRGKVSIISPTKVTPEQAYSISSRSCR